MKDGKKTPKGVYDTVIIGGGPAGLTAGLYVARARMNALLVESFNIMSQLTMTEVVENYPGIERISGFELVSIFKKQAENFGLMCQTGTVKSLSLGEKGGFPIWKVEEEKGTIEALSVIIATGAVPRKLNVPGEDKFLGKGISYCAVCDAAFFRDKEIVVVGGGNAAVEEALYLTRFVKKVTVVHRRERLRADKVFQEEAFSNEKMDFMMDAVVEEIGGGEKVEKIVLKKVKTGQMLEMACEGVFIYAGWKPNTDFLKDFLNMNEKGRVIVDQGMKTSQEGVFACGDCCQKTLHQIVTACGDGAVAANSAKHYVDELKGIAYK